jgi:hypothetical protein
MLATYGLRPHEVFRLDVTRYNRKTEVLRVADETKTGTRLVYPCPASWREIVVFLIGYLLVVHLAFVGPTQVNYFAAPLTDDAFLTLCVFCLPL